MRQIPLLEHAGPQRALLRLLEDPDVDQAVVAARKIHLHWQAHSLATFSRHKHMLTLSVPGETHSVWWSK